MRRVLVELLADRPVHELHAALSRAGARVDDRSPPVPMTFNAHATLCFSAEIDNDDAALDRIRQAPGVVGVFADPAIGPT